MPLVLFNTALTYGTVTQDKVCKTLTAQMANQTDAPLVLMDQGGAFMHVEFGKTGALTSQMRGHAPVVFGEAYRISSEKSWAMLSANPLAGIRRAEISPTLDTTTPTPAKAQGGLMVLTNRVRRLTPVECERLMGFPDNWTRVPYRGRPAEACPDSPRYRAIGNSWAVPCIRWIGERIQKQLEGENK